MIDGLLKSYHIFISMDISEKGISILTNMETMQDNKVADINALARRTTVRNGQ